MRLQSEASEAVNRTPRAKFVPTAAATAFEAELPADFKVIATFSEAI